MKQLLLRLDYQHQHCDHSYRHHYGSFGLVIVKVSVGYCWELSQAHVEKMQHKKDQ